MKINELSDLELAYQIQIHRNQIDSLNQALSLLLNELSARIEKAKNEKNNTTAG